MKKSDLFLALLVVIVWGANFTVIKIGLDGLPPMLLAAFRYTFTALPAVLIVKRPKVKCRYWVAYGLTVGLGQFACLFYAMYIGMPAGVSSVVLQAQAFFTLIFAAIFLHESFQSKQIFGLMVAASGLFFIGLAADTSGELSVPIAALLLTILASAFWGISNIVVRFAAKKAEESGEKLNMLSLVVWSSLIPPIPFLGFALIMDDTEALINTIADLKYISIFAILYLAYIATIFGYGTWSVLLSKYTAGKVAPLSLLVPVTGLLTAQIVLREELSQMQWMGSGVVLVGLIISNFGIAPFKKFFGGKSEKF